MDDLDNIDEDEILKSANAISGRLDELERPLWNEIFDLFEKNMKSHYQTTWGWNKNDKIKEFNDPASRFVMLFERDSLNGRQGCVAAFATFRFEWDDPDEPEYPVLYCYELQVLPKFQGIGLGRYLMDLITIVAQKTKMRKVMLTCFKCNVDALNFYRKIGFIVDSNSPSSHGLTDEDYEILSKIVAK